LNVIHDHIIRGAQARNYPREEEVDQGNDWAEKYDTETLEYVYGRLCSPDYDPARLFDAEYYAKRARDRERVLDVLRLRKPEEYA